ncbi:hypothetical protein D1007_05628 [Hordeum vulgare]|nr:hypothetical protein D1007_05628 [Hordeum vulgare]
MVIQIFGIQSGFVPFPVDNTKVVIVNRVPELRAQYLKCGQEKIPLDNIVTMMKNDEIEEGFNRSFMFLFIRIVFYLATRNYANWKLLYGLHNTTQLKTFDLAQLCIDHLNKEIDNFSTKLLNRTKVSLNKSIFVGGCLPLASIVYLDFVDFTKASKQANINYGVPRMADIHNEDFDYLTLVDLNRASKKPFALGFLPKIHEQHVQNMYEEMKAIVMSLQHDSNNQVNNAGTSTTNPIILLSEVRRRNIISEPVNTNAKPVHASTDPIIEELFQDDLGNVSELVQTKESKLEEKVNANITPSMQMQKQLDIVQTGRDTEPNQIGCPSVNTPIVNLQQNSPSGNSISITEQKSPAVSVLNETESKEMSDCCPSVPFLSQNNAGLDIVLSPLDPKGKQPSKYCFTSYFMIINMRTLSKSVGWTYKNAQNFDCISRENYPQQNNLQVVAYKLAKSKINEEEFQGLQEDVSTKKRKKRR